jgi:signal transduction histidine kinase/PAS domain-containing protein
MSPGGLWYSVTSMPPFGDLMAIDRDSLEVPHPTHVLLIDLPFDPADAQLLAAVRDLARRPVTSPRLFAAVGLVGNIDLLDPDEISSLRTDAFADRPTTAFLTALKSRGAERIRTQLRVNDYRHISRRLNLGCGRFRIGDLSLEWADEALARLLGFASETELARAYPTLDQLFNSAEDMEQLLATLARTRDQATIGELRLRGKRDLWASVFHPPDTKESLILLLHDSREIFPEWSARNRVANLLEEVGFAYFVCDSAGRTLFCNTRDLEILEVAQGVAYRRSRREWFANPREFDNLIATGVTSPSSRCVLLKTDKGREVWVEAAFKTIEDSSDGPLRIEAAYRDVNLTMRLAQAISQVSGPELGLVQTARTILDALGNILDSRSSAIVLHNDARHRVFPLCLRGDRKFGEVLILTEIDDWWSRACADGASRAWRKESLPEQVIEFFGENAGSMHSLCFLPLNAAGPTNIAIWLAMPEHPDSEPSAPATLGPLLERCERQLQIAVTRDAYSLGRSLMSASQSLEVTTLERLDGFLREDAQRILQRYLPMEACSIFRIGIEELSQTLTMSATSGLKSGATVATYQFGEGLTGTVAERGERLTFDISSEPERRGKHIENAAHPLQTWVGLPMRDRRKRTVGVIRCVNRLVDNLGGKAITGFSDFDLIVLREFAKTCGMFIELVLSDTHRQRTVARIAHEIRSPIIAIRNNLEYLSEHYLFHDEKYAAKRADLDLDAAILLDQIRKLDMVVQRPGTATGDLIEIKRVHLRDIIWKTYYTMVPELQVRGIDTSASRPIEVVGRLPMLYLPPAGIAQIVFNLFWNAIKYSQPDPAQFHIWVIFEAWDTGSFTIRFRDRGIGIHERYKDKIFEENFRTPEGRLHDPTGFGLGLPLSRGLARDLGGDLVLNTTKSSAEFTTEFVLTLPKRLAKSPQQVAQQANTKVAKE